MMPVVHLACAPLRVKCPLHELIMKGDVIDGQIPVDANPIGR